MKIIVKRVELNGQILPVCAVIKDQVSVRAKNGSNIGLVTVFGNRKPFKIGEKCFLFHLKSSFCSQDI